MTPRVFTAESFGSNLPDNWEAIADFLEALIDRYGYDYSEDAEEIHDTANDIWDTFFSCPGMIADMAVYGRDNTHLTLTDKASACYAGINPCTITEYRAGYNYLYQFTVSGETSDIMTETELNDAFEAMYKEWACDVINEKENKTMKIKAMVNGIECEVEVTENQVYDAYKTLEKRLDIEDVRYFCEGAEEMYDAETIQRILDNADEIADLFREYSNDEWEDNMQAAVDFFLENTPEA